jgi:hypothetical protein
MIAVNIRRNYSARLCDGRLSLMMMAHDSTQGPGSLDEETIRAVRGALVEYIDSPARSGALRRALRVMAAEARERSMLPEQLLIVLKDIWYSLPDVRRMPEPDDRIRLLQRVVTICIKEYYAD